MAMLNQLTVIGRVGKEPESGSTKKGGTYTRFRLAVDQGKEEEPLWISVVCWGSLATRVFPRLHKGSPEFAQGRFHLQAYTDKNKGERQSVELMASNIQQGVRHFSPLPIKTEIVGTRFERT